MAIQDQTLEEIKNRIDIVELISSYVDLKPAGKNYRGLCPFHDEKTPSFTVSPEKGIFHCFGCGAGGSIFNFIMKVENLSFQDAVIHLSQKAGIELPTLRRNIQNKEYRQKGKIIQLNQVVQKYYYDSLLHSEDPLARTSRQYLFQKRGIKPSSAEQFGLGYSPADGKAIIEYLYQQGFNGNDFIQAGIGNVIKKGELYDRFRGRITFALHDSNGEIVGFAGRTLLENENPKYINSSESPVFSKGNNLYGLFATKSDIRKTKTVILVEGYMDFLSLFENQITNCVASMGTALTAHQATLIRRFAEEVVICYDSDNAGRMATFRGIDILTKKGLSVKIAVLPSPYDPDTYLRKKGREAFLEILEQKKPIFDYQLELLLNEYGSKSLESQIHIIRGLLPSINAMTDSIERSLKIRSLAQYLKIPESLIYNVLKGTRESEKKVKLFKTAQKDAIHGAIKAEKILVKFLLEEPTVRSMICDQVPAEYFSVPEHRRIYQAILSNLGEEFSLSDLINVFSGDELMSSCISALGSTETECYEMNEELIQSLIKTLKRAELRRERSILASELAQQADYESKLLIGKRIEEIDKEIQGLKTCS